MSAPVKLLYFAWLREKAGVGEEDVLPPAEVATAETHASHREKRAR